MNEYRNRILMLSLVVLFIFGHCLFLSCKSSTPSNTETTNVCGKKLYKAMGRHPVQVFYQDKQNCSPTKIEFPNHVNLSNLRLRKEENKAYGVILDYGELSKMVSINLPEGSMNDIIFFEDQNIGNLALSRDNRFLAYQISPFTPYEIDMQALNSLVVFDLQNSTQRNTLKNITTEGRISIHENAWHPDNNHLLFVVGKRKNRAIMDKDFYLKPGIYLYNIQLDINTKVGPVGRDAQFNSNGELVAFSNKTDIQLLNLETKESTTVFELTDNFFINSFSWSPCNPKEMLIVYFDKTKRTSKQVIYNLKTKNTSEIPGRMFIEKNYSWRK